VGGNAWRVSGLATRTSTVPRTVSASLWAPMAMRRLRRQDGERRGDGGSRDRLGESPGPGEAGRGANPLEGRGDLNSGLLSAESAVT